MITGSIRVGPGWSRPGDGDSARFSAPAPATGGPAGGPVRPRPAPGQSRSWRGRLCEPPDSRPPPPGRPIGPGARATLRGRTGRRGSLRGGGGEVLVRPRGCQCTASDNRVSASGIAPSSSRAQTTVRRPGRRRRAPLHRAGRAGGLTSPSTRPRLLCWRLLVRESVTVTRRQPARGRAWQRAATRSS